MESDGSLRLLMITSRETRRWVIPKGNHIRGLPAHLAAAHEAYEEAGVSGIACPSAIGSYRYLKRRKDGSTRQVAVDVFPLAFVAQADEWPEQGERDTRWFTLAEAAEAVEEAELKAIIASFSADAPLAGRGTGALSWLRRKISGRVPMLRWFHALMPK